MMKKCMILFPLNNNGLQLKNMQQEKKKKIKKKGLCRNCSNGSNEYDVPPVKVQEAENHVRRR